MLQSSSKTWYTCYEKCWNKTICKHCTANIVTKKIATTLVREFLWIRIDQIILVALTKLHHCESVFTQHYKHIYLLGKKHQLHRFTSTMYPHWTKNFSHNLYPCNSAANVLSIFLELKVTHRWRCCCRRQCRCQVPEQEQWLYRLACCWSGHSSFINFGMLLSLLSSEPHSAAVLVLKGAVIQSLLLYMFLHNFYQIISMLGKN